MVALKGGVSTIIVTLSTESVKRMIAMGVFGEIGE
jgi:hypothetical protein